MPSGKGECTTEIWRELVTFRMHSLTWHPYPIGESVLDPVALHSFIERQDSLPSNHSIAMVKKSACV
jgi:hypothetical protein